MPEYITDFQWTAVIQIIVIALACRNLEPKQRTQGMIYGTLGAVILRVILVSFAVVLLDIPFLKMLGGLLLLYIGIKLLQPEDDAHDNIHASDRLLSAVKTIILADLVMSIDNVVAIAGAAENAPSGHRIFLVILGLIVSIPLVVSGSALLLKVIERVPMIVIGGAGLLGWIAGGLIIDDPFVDRFDWLQSDFVNYLSCALGAAIVICAGLGIKSIKAKRKAAQA